MARPAADRRSGHLPSRPEVIAVSEEQDVRAAGWVDRADGRNGRPPGTGAAAAVPGQRSGGRPTTAGPRAAEPVDQSVPPPVLQQEASPASPPAPSQPGAPEPTAGAGPAPTPGGDPT